MTSSIKNSDLCTRPETYIHAIDISGAETDSQLIGMWLSGRPANTVRAYQTDVERYQRHVAKPMRQVTAADLISYAESLTNLAASTQHRKLSVIKSLFSFSLKLGYISLDPAAALRLPKPANNRASKLLTVEQVQEIIQAAKPGRDRLICKSLYYLGIREAELIALQVDDIHATPTGHAVTIRGKGDKQRVIAIPQALAGGLTTHCDAGAIFASASGNALNPSTVYRIVRQAGERAGIHGAPHLLRHACASHALANGAPLSIVRETLGHSSLSTTSIYVHANPEDSAGMYLDNA